MSATFLDILKPALRRAGITKRPGITPAPDQTDELIATANRLLESWSCTSHVVFTTAIDEFALNAGQKIYSYGPGGDLNAARPICITEANFLFPTTPVLRRPIAILDDDQWSKIAVQDIAGAPAWALYYDGSFDANGRAKLYIIGQPPTGYQLELYTWQALKSDFTATSDAFIFPPGYAFALETNLALQATLLYPLESVVATNPRAMAELRVEAQKALRALIVLNSSSPVLRSEIAWLGQGGAGGWGSQISVVAGGSGGSGTVTWISPNSAPDGIATTFTFAKAPQFAEFNGLLQFSGAVSGVSGHAGYESLGTAVLRFIADDGTIITPGVTDSVKAAV